LMTNISAFGLQSCVDFCAYHSAYGAPGQDHFFYGVMPDLNNTGCDQGCAAAFNYFESVTTISSHEYTEAITDPFPTPGTKPAYPQAWNDNQGNEVGDLCQGSNDTLAYTGGNYVIQSEFDNSKNGCTSATWKSQ